MGKVRSFRDLRVYQELKRLHLEVHDESLTFPRFGLYELGSQMRRSSNGAPAIPAEGYGSRHTDIYLEAMRYLNLVGLGDRAHEDALGIPFGQQKLVAIARAMATEPHLLMLDEPGSGLNALEKDALGDLIRRIRELGTTILLVEHDVNMVMSMAEWIVVLDHGVKIAEGTPSEVRRNPRVISAYLGEEAADAGGG